MKKLIAGGKIRKDRKKEGRREEKDQGWMMKDGKKEEMEFVKWILLRQGREKQRRPLHLQGEGIEAE